MSSLCAAVMRRCFATECDHEECVYVRKCERATGLRLRIMAAYASQPLRPGPLVVDGCVVLEDPWRESLEEHLDGLFLHDDVLSRMMAFDLERFLGEKVHTVGSEAMKAQFVALQKMLDATCAPPSTFDDAEEGVYMGSGLPINLYDIRNQPLQEIEVYRSLDDLAIGVDDADDDDHPDGDVATRLPEELRESP